MRKIVWIGAAGVIFAGSVVGYAQSIKSDAIARVDKAFEGLRARGATVTHAPINVSLWTRAAGVTNVKIVSPGRPDTTFSVDRISVSGIAARAASGSAKTVLIEGVTITTDDNGASPMMPAGTYRIPRAQLQDVQIIPAPQEPSVTSGDSLMQAVAAFATLNAGRIEIPEIKADMMVPIPPTNAGAAKVATVSYTYSDIKLENINDGRIGLATIASVALKGGADYPLREGTAKDLVMRDIDILPLFKLGLSRRQPVDQFYKTQGATSAASYVFQTADGGAFSIDKIKVESVWSNPDKFSIADLKTFMSVLQAATPDAPRQQQAALLQQMAEIYASFRMPMLEFSLTASGGPRQPFDMSIGRIALVDFDRGKLQQLRIEKLRGTVPNPNGRAQPVNIGLMAIDGIDFASLMSLTAEAAGNARPDPGAMADKAFKLVSGFEIAGVSVPEPRSGLTIDIERMKASWGDYVGPIPTAIAVEAKGKIPLDPTDPRSAPLIQSGLRAFDAAVEIKTKYDKDRKVVTVSPLDVDLGQMSAVKSTMTLGNVGTEAFSLDQRARTAAIQNINIDTFDLSVRDQGTLALMAKIAGPDVGAQMATAARQSLMASTPGQPLPNAEKLSSALATFLARPNQTLSLSLKPRSRVTLAEVVATSVAVGQAAALEAFDITTNVK